MIDRIIFRNYNMNRINTPRQINIYMQSTFNMCSLRCRVTSYQITRKGHQGHHKQKANNYKLTVFH